MRLQTTQRISTRADAYRTVARPRAFPLSSAADRDMPLPSPHTPYETSLGGKVILITGAAGGLGRALSLACARRGATVVIHGRTVRKLEALYDEIKDAGHPEPIILPMDLATAHAEDFANVASALQVETGRLD